jgi:hypothetical protein
MSPFNAPPRRLVPHFPSPKTHLWGLFVARNRNECVFAGEGVGLLDDEAEVGGEQGRHQGKLYVVDDGAAEALDPVDGTEVA